MDLSLANIINISVSETPVGLSSYNTSNLALFSYDSPNVSFGTDGYKIYKEPTEVATDFGTSSVTYKMALAVFSQAPNILANSGYLVVIEMEPAETLDDAITRTLGLVQYTGIMSTQIESQSDMLAAAAVVQANPTKIGFFVQKASASIEVGGSLDLLRSGSFTNARGLYYGSSADLDALLYQAAYAGRALSVVFAGSNTTITMHLKTLKTIQPDPSMNQTLFNKAKTAGADVYVSFQVSPGVNSSGANKFFDQVYNLCWLIGALQIAGFNLFKQTPTKIPQTSEGVNALGGAYRKVCQQGIANQYGAPGEWTSPTTFGNQEDMLENIRQLGFYIYVAPIAEQLQADREARIAPLVQIAFKEAGAMQTSNVVVNINA